jgi:hypothetical protein
MSNRDQAIQLLEQIQKAHLKKNDSPHFHIGYLQALIGTLANKDSSILTELTETLDWANQ